MYKQKNIVVKPETKALAEEEFAILERFGWRCVRELPMGDDGVVVSYIRDDADTANVSAEAEYREALFAKKYAEEVTDELSAKLQAKKRDSIGSIIGRVVLGTFAFISTALFALVAFIDVFFSKWSVVLGEFTYGKNERYPLGGGWEFLNTQALGYAELKIVLSLFLLGVATALVSAFVISIVKASKRAREAKALAAYCEEKISYFDGVIKECDEKLK